MFSRGVALVLLSVAASCVMADTCMVSPTSKEQVSGRFGKFRAGGAANYGSGNTKPHMHDGLDFSTSGTAAPLFATTAGTVIWAMQRGAAGNTVIIRRDNGDLVAYYHMSSMSVHQNDKVQPGQQIGLSGNSGMGAGGAVHLHFIYGVPQSSDARAKSFAADAAKNPSFNPAQLPNAITKPILGDYPTDPSPYFCKTYPIQSDALSSVLGSDTMAQYNKLFGAAPPAGSPPATQFEPVQVAAAEIDSLQAQSGGQPSVEASLSDSDGYGALPSPPIGDYDTMSPLEMMTTEARRRFADSEWNTNVATVSSRALWVDYLRALGVSAYINEAIRQKKERVEALLALYTSQKLAAEKAQVTAMRDRAQRADVMHAIK
jgi:hypothetical protein